MLGLRPSQMERLKEVMMEDFRQRLLAHVQANWKAEAERLQPPGVEKTIQSALDVSERHGLKSEFEIASLLDLMMVFGSDFTEAPECAWAAEILRQEKLAGPEKIRLLNERATRELEDAAQAQQT